MHHIEEPWPRAHFEQVLPGLAYRVTLEDLSSIDVDDSHIEDSDFNRGFIEDSEFNNSNSSGEAFDNQGYTEAEILKISEIESNQDNSFTVISCLRNDSTDECIFCLDIPVRLEVVRRLRCMHVFHKECFDEYFDEGNNQKNTCPICKEAVKPESDC